MVKRFCKRTPLIEAIEWTGANTAEVRDFVGAVSLDTVEVKDEQRQWCKGLVVPTPEGYHLAIPGDMILRSPPRVCKRPTFDQLYESEEG